MQVPLPHASFPKGETIPFTITPLTDELGKQWYPSGHYLAPTIQGEVYRADGRHLSTLYFTRSANPYLDHRHTALLRTEGWTAGPYRYRIWLNYADPPRSYTLQQGTFTLY